MMRGGRHIMVGEPSPHICHGQVVHIHMGIHKYKEGLIKTGEIINSEPWHWSGSCLRMI